MPRRLPCLRHCRLRQRRYAASYAAMRHYAMRTLFYDKSATPRHKTCRPSFIREASAARDSFTRCALAQYAAHGDTRCVAATCGVERYYAGIVYAALDVADMMFYWRRCQQI